MPPVSPTDRPEAPPVPATCPCGALLDATDTELCPECLEAWWEDYAQAALALDHPL